MDEYDEIARAGILPSWEVYDADGQRIGEVDEVGDTSLVVRLTTSFDTAFEVDFRDVESAGDGRVDLSIAADELTANLQDAG
jgi:hypothetical protein